MNIKIVYNTDLSIRVRCINNDTYNQTGISFIEVYRWLRKRFLRRTRFLQRIFIACKRVRSCVRAACSRACVRERNTEKFGLSSPLPPSLHLLLLPRLFRSLFLPLASRSPEAKEARVLLRLTFSGMNYLARQVPVSNSRYCDFAIRRRNTRWEYPLRVDDVEIVTLFKVIDNIKIN